MDSVTPEPLRFLFDLFIGFGGVLAVGFLTVALLILTVEIIMSVVSGYRRGRDGR